MVIVMLYHPHTALPCVVLAVESSSHQTLVLRNFHLRPLSFHWLYTKTSPTAMGMNPFFLVVLSVAAFATVAMASPVPTFDDVEKAWKEGHSEVCRSIAVISILPYARHSRISFPH